MAIGAVDVPGPEGAGRIESQMNLQGAASEPGAGDLEARPLNDHEAKQVLIEGERSRQIGDNETNMVERKLSHRRRLMLSQTRGLPLLRCSGRVLVRGPNAQRPPALRRQLFDFRAHFCHSAPMETHAFGFRLPANAPEGEKRFPISSPVIYVKLIAPLLLRLKKLSGPLEVFDLILGTTARKTYPEADDTAGQEIGQTASPTAFADPQHLTPLGLK